MGKNPGGAIYGTLTVGALLAAERASRETYAKTIGAVAVAMALYWLAHAYASSAEHRLREEEPLTPGLIGRTMLHEVSILVGAALPLLAVVLFGLFGAALGTAVSAGVWTSAIVIVSLEVSAAVGADLHGRELVIQVAIGAVLGVLVIVLKALLH
jgi:small-conductance mechanosensitive channel